MTFLLFRGGGLARSHRLAQTMRQTINAKLPSGRNHGTLAAACMTSSQPHIGLDPACARIYESQVQRDTVAVAHYGDMHNDTGCGVRCSAPTFSTQAWVALS
jgi:hypothetical protein